MMELVWWSNQASRSYNVWTYNFSSVSTTLQAYSLLSGAICRCCTHTSSTVVVSSDAFQIMTDCWHTRTHTHTHGHSHIITQPQTQTLFLSHMYTNFYTHSPAHTGTHTQTPVSECANGSGNMEHIFKAFTVSSRRNPLQMFPTSLILKDEPSQRLCFVYRWAIRSLQLWINSHSMQPRPKEGIRHRLKEQRAKGGLGVGLCANTIIVLLLRRQDSTSLSLW